MYYVKIMPLKFPTYA